MKRVKGIYENHVVKLLEDVDVEDGSEVDVIFANHGREVKARQFKWLEQGFHMGKLSRRDRAELHER